MTRSAANPSSVTVSTGCNKYSSSGKRILNNGTLTSSTQSADGRYNATIGRSTRLVAYNIVTLIPEIVHVEYDCVREFGFTKYGIHIRSRTPTLSTAILNKYLDLVQQLNLNPAKLEFALAPQPFTCVYD